MTVSAAVAGRRMSAEMDEQPDVLARMVGKFDEIAHVVRERSGFKGVAFLARGSSDHAALLGRYAVEILTGLPTCLVAPSVTSAYRRHPLGFEGWLLVALSQSGRTPEIVTLAADFAAAGATVVGITNEAGSALSAATAYTIELDAGAETAVPATKTVTAQMLAVLAVTAGLDRTSATLTAESFAGLSNAVATVLGDRTAPETIAARLSGRDRLAVVGRGFCYPAALETALKLQETTGIMAHGFSTADFRHGPIAVCGPSSPAVLMAGTGPVDDDTRELRAPLAARDADCILIGAGVDADAGWLTSGLPAAAECILATVRGQQLALAVATGRGIDPDHPAGLSKITYTH